MKSAGAPRSESAVKRSRTSSRARSASVCAAMIRPWTASVRDTNFTSRWRAISARPPARVASTTTSGTDRRAVPSSTTSPETPASMSSPTNDAERRVRSATPTRSTAAVRLRSAGGRSLRCRRHGPTAREHRGRLRRRELRGLRARLRRDRPPRGRWAASREHRQRPDDPSGCVRRLGARTSSGTRLLGPGWDSLSLDGASRSVRTG